MSMKRCDHDDEQCDERQTHAGNWRFERFVIPKHLDVADWWRGNFGYDTASSSSVQPYHLTGYLSSARRNFILQIEVVDFAVLPI